jgi:hypothetical protein
MIIVIDTISKKINGVDISSIGGGRLVIFKWSDVINVGIMWLNFSNF